MVASEFLSLRLYISSQQEIVLFSVERAKIVFLLVLATYLYFLLLFLVESAQIRRVTFFTVDFAILIQRPLIFINRVPPTGRVRYLSKETNFLT